MEAIKKEATEESLKAVSAPGLKSIPIKYHPKIKFLIKKDEEETEVDPDKKPETRPMSTLDLIEAVLKHVPAGPHGEQPGVKGYEQHKIFKVLDKMEELPASSTQFEVKEKEFELIKKKAKTFPWGSVDRFFTQFEESLGIVYDDKDAEK